MLSEGTAEHVRWFIDLNELIDLWDELVLPRAVSLAWISWIAERRGVMLVDWRDRVRQRDPVRFRVVALTALQERLAALISGLDESDGFALAGGAGLAAHGLLERSTRDLDYFGPPEAPEGVGRLADAIQQACIRGGVDGAARAGGRHVRSPDGGRWAGQLCGGHRHRLPRTGNGAYPPRPDWTFRELGANKVLAIFDRAAPRDCLDLQELTRRFSLPDLIALAAQKDRGIDLDPQFLRGVEAAVP